MYTITKKIAVLMAMGLMTAQLHAASSELETDAVSPAATGAGEPLEAGAVPATGAGEPDLEHRPRHLRVSVADLEGDPEWHEFLDAEFVYRPNPSNDDGKIVWRFRDILKDHIADGAITFPVRVHLSQLFNLPKRHALAQHIRVYIGYKYQKMFGSGKSNEFWICPRALAALKRHEWLIQLMPKFTSRVGYFFALGPDDADQTKQDYSLDQEGDIHNRFYALLRSRKGGSENPGKNYIHYHTIMFKLTAHLSVEFPRAG